MIKSIYEQLNEKFQANISASLSDNSSLREEIELRARAISAFCEICGKSTVSSHHRELSEIFNEVFSDLIVSVYQASCALDKPAQVTLRTGFELGISIVYLWDYPTQYWAWREHDRDLSFTEMIDYVGSEPYKTTLFKIHGKDVGHDIDTGKCKEVYRRLSNTTHGKPSSHESNLRDRFNYTSEDWNSHLRLVRRVEIELLTLFSCRFYHEYMQIKDKLPKLKSL